MANATRTARFRFWLWLIRLIGVLVPRRLRADWRQEWEAELRYREELLAEWDRLDWRNKLDLLRRSLGAFRDALLLQPKRLEDEMFQDLRFGVRMLLKHKGFTAVAVLTLALGIGANTAIFSFVNALLLRPLKGVSTPEQLVLVVTTFNNKPFDQMSYPNYLDYSQQNTTLAGLAMYQHTLLHLSFEQEAERITGAMVTGNYFEVLGVKAEAGRLIATADVESDGASPVAVLSRNLWRNRFGADPNVIGQSIRLNNYVFTVVGVASEGFAGTVNGAAADVWVPVTMWRQADPQLARLAASWRVDWFKSRDSRFMSAFGRLKPGVTIEQAQAELSTIAQRLQQAYPETNQRAGIRLLAGLGLSSGARNQASQFVKFPLVIVGIVLLIACANIAGLLLARANARRKEIAIRLALGAPRSRIIRQLLTESVLLALAGGFLGIFVAISLSDWLRTSLPERHLSMPLKLDLALDVRVLGFTILVSVLTGLLSGLAPAWHSARRNLIPTLKDQLGSGPHLGQTSIRGLVVVTQIALSLVLLIAAGLCIRTLQKTQAINVGFDAERVLTARVDLSRQQYSEAQGRLFFEQLLDRMTTIPGVQAASFALDLPLTGRYSSTGIYPEGRPVENSRVQVSYNVVTPQYLETVRIPLLLGRPFSAQDSPQSPLVAIVNETLVQRVWPNENPLGKRFRFSDTKSNQPLIEVIGVARDARGAKLFDDPLPHLYLPFAQRYQDQMVLHLRTSGRPEQFIAAMQQEIAKLDRNLPVYGVKTLASYHDDALTPQRLTALLVSGFGGLATLLAMIGLYGVMANAVMQRTREIGIRMALGAQVRDVLRLVIGQGMKLALIGIVIGLGGALALTRLMKTLLFGVSAADPPTFVSVALLLTLVALVACWLPARRATKVDPLAALRHE